jgi:FHA domain
VFTRVFSELDACMSGLPGDGLLLVAVWNGKAVETHLHVPLDVQDGQNDGRGAQQFVTVGRHTACDLKLDRDDSVSLRHLVVGIGQANGGVRVRLYDLATGVGLCTEDGIICEALTAEGAAFVTVGDYHLLLLPTGRLAPLPWSGPAALAWAAIPERIYFDRRTVAQPARLERDQPRPAPRSRPVRLLRARPGRSITTQIIDPPTRLRAKRPAAGNLGPRLGTLVLSTGGITEPYDVHATELDRGLLIGRYERCTVGAEDDRLSRVHLMLLREGDQIWAIDTASSNGTCAAGTPIRQLRLESRAQLDLGAAVTMRWTADEPEGAPPRPTPSLIDAPLDDLLRFSVENRKR